jgi:hypothetical protein
MSEFACNSDVNSDQPTRKIRRGLQLLEDQKPVATHEEEYDDEEEEEEMEEGEEDVMDPFEEEPTLMAPVPSSEKNWRKTIVAFRISGSMKQFSQSQEDPIARISENATIFDLGPKIKGKAERTTQHVIGGVKLLGVQSTFPCSLTINPTGLVGMESTSHDACGNCGYVVFPGQNSDNLNVELVSIGKTKTLDIFKGQTIESLNKGIEFKSESKSAYDPKKREHVSETRDNMIVDPGHTLISMYNAMAISMNRAPITEKNLVKGKFIFEAAEGKKLLGIASKALESQLRINNLHNLGIKVSRAFLSETPVPVQAPARGLIESMAVKTEESPVLINQKWTNEAEIFDTYQNKSKVQTAVLEKTNVLLIRTEITWTPQEEDA